MIGLQNVKVEKSFESETLVQRFTSIVEQQGPLFISRIGGFDYNVVVKYFNNRKYYAAPSWHNSVTTIMNSLYMLLRGGSGYGMYNNYKMASSNMKTITGYFDFENQYGNFIQFLDKMILYYKNSNFLTYGGSQLIKKFDADDFGDDARFIQYILEGKTAIHYGFFDAVRPFLTSFTRWGAGKKILIVSPFSNSLLFQFQRKNKLLQKYTFPDFQLVTYNTPITYNTSGDSKESLHIQTKNWHEQCELMNQEISTIDFDIAWLSCASYAMSIGNYIKETMGKKAIYVGGILNVIFNIYGGRYNTPYYNGIVDLDYQIEALENDLVASIRGGRDTPSESINAYFGKRRASL